MPKYDRRSHHPKSEFFMVHSSSGIDKDHNAFGWPWSAHKYPEPGTQLSFPVQTISGAITRPNSFKQITLKDLSRTRSATIETANHNTNNGFNGSPQDLIIMHAAATIENRQLLKRRRATSCSVVITETRLFLVMDQVVANGAAIDDIAGTLRQLAFQNHGISKSYHIGPDTGYLIATGISC